MSHLRLRLMRAVAPPCGRASRNVLYGLCRTAGDRKAFDVTLDYLVATGAMRQYGTTKSTTYGLPAKRGKA